MLKKCNFCGSTNVVRNGLRVRFQLYKCKDCGRKFRGGTRIEKLQIISNYVKGKQTCRQLSEKYGVSARTISRYLFLHVSCPEGLQGPECGNTDGYDLLGAWFRSDGHQGCPEEQGSLAKVCHTWDHSRLYGRHKIAEKPGFQNLWSSHRRNTRSGTGALALPSTALSVPPDIDRTALLDPRTRVGRIQGSTGTCLQYQDNGQSGFP